MMRIELAGKASKAGPVEPARPRAARRGRPVSILSNRQGRTDTL